jgi:competence protein ComEC
LGGLALAWIAGVAVQLQQRSLGPVGWCIAAIALGVLGWVLAWRWRRAFVAALMGTALVAYGASGWRASVRLADALPAVLEGQVLSVTGVIASLPQRSAAGLRFRFEVDTAERNGEPVQIPALLAIGWYNGWHEDARRYLHPGPAYHD